MSKFNGTVAIVTVTLAHPARTLGRRYLAEG